MEVNKLATYLGIAASIAAIGGAIYYFASGRNAIVTRNIGGVNFNHRVQPNRDRRLGHAGRTRKYFGAIGTSSGQGAGLAASLPSRIGQYGKNKIQMGNGSTQNYQGNGGNRQLHVTNRTNRSNRASIAAVTTATAAS